VSLLGGLLTCAVAALSFVRAANLDARQRSLRDARALAADVASGQPHRELLFAAVASEPRPSKYSFLRKRMWRAHPDGARVGHAIDDKAMHDLLAEAQRSGEVASFADDGTLTLARPTSGGTAIIRMAATHRQKRLPLTALASALVVGLALTLFGRGRHALGALGVVATSVVAATSVAVGAPGVILTLFAAVPGLTLHLLASRGLFERLREHRFAYAYLLPAAVGMTLLVLIPFALGCALGFFDHQHGRFTFVGLANFREILGSAEFYGTLLVTFAWTVINVFLHVSIGLCLALVLREPWIRLRGLWRVLLILPWAVPNYITGLIWKGMFHQQYGAINALLEACGLARVSWFSSFAPAFTANVVTNTWLGFPFMMVVALGALQSIPREVYEAAAVDGASRSARFFRITLPLLRPALFPAVILGCIWTFNQFNIIYLVSEGKPNGRTDILITEAYRWAFERGERYGHAAAYGMLIFLSLLGFSVLAARATRATEAAQ
jgi:ABC-type sugar transport system permease subunit